MSKKFMISIVLALIFSLTTVSTALANPPEPPDGLPKGWYYIYTCLSADIFGGAIGSGTYTWWLPPEFIDEIDSDPDHPWFWPGESFGHCVNVVPTEVQFVAGSTYDVWYNQCGVHIQTAPAGGTATLVAIDKPADVKFSQRPCALSFTNLAGESVSNFGVSASYYFNLDRVQYDRFLDGTLVFVINDGTGWVECPATLVGVDLENDDYGRLVCSSTAVLQFGLVIK